MRMSWVRSKAVLTATVVGFALFGAPGSAKAGIVVASSGPSAGSYPAGKKLPDDSKITLRAGDSVTILDGSGTRILRGAGTFTIGRSASTRTRSSFAALTRQRSSTRVRTGAVRGSGSDEPPRSPNLWYVDVTRPGTMCVTDTDAVRLWRPDTTAKERFTVNAADGSSSAAVNFFAGSMIAVWDVSAAPVADGAAFKIRKDGSSQSGDLVFAVLPEQPASPEELATALIERGCNNQLELLTSTLETSGS